MIGKSTGIALLMAAALLAALFAMGVFSATGVGAAVPSGATVELDNYAPEAEGVTLKAKFQATVAGDDPADSTDGTTDNITITLPPGITELAEDSVTVMQAGELRGAATVSGQVITIDPDAIADTDDATTGDQKREEIVANQEVTVTITDLVNPDNESVAMVAFNQNNPDGDDSGSTDGDPADALMVSVEFYSIEHSSQKPGAAVRIGIKASSTEPVAVGEDLVITFPKGFVVPPTISESHVLFRDAGDDTLNTYVGSPSEARVDGQKLVLTIPTLNPAGDAANPNGVSGPYEVVIKQSAGITNPNVGGSYSIGVKDGDTRDSSFPVTVQRTITLDKTSGPRGTVAVVTGKGFTSGRSATVYLQQARLADLADDATTMDVDESEAADAAAGSPIGDKINLGTATITDGTFTFNVDTDSPDFTVYTWGDPTKGANVISATDGANKSSDVNGYFQIKAKATLGDTSAAHSEILNIKVADWTDVTIGKVEIGGVNAPFRTAAGEAASAPVVLADRTANFYVQVPAGARTGSQTVSVHKDATSAAGATATLDVGVLELTVEPATASRGETITITGSGFTGSTVTKITVGASTSTEEVSEKIADACEVRSSGALSCTVSVPVNKSAVRDGENHRQGGSHRWKDRSGNPDCPGSIH